MLKIITILGLLWGCLSNSFSLASYSLVPNYAKSSSSIYTFTLNAVSSFNASFDIHVYFQTQFTPSSVSNCMFWLNNNPVSNVMCTANTSSNTITFSNLNINSSISSYKIQFNTSTARYAGSSILTFYYYDTATQTFINQLTNYVSLSIVNAVMSCTIGSTSTIVGDNATYTISYTPLVPIEASSILQVQIQPWGAYSQSNFITTNTSVICNGSCTLSLPSSNGNLSQLLRYSSMFPTDLSASGAVVLNKARNPASTKEITMSMVLLAKISAFSQYSYQNCTSTISVPTPNAFKLTNFATTVTDISSSNIITLRLQLTNPISSISYLRIQPNSLGLTFQYNFNNQGTQPFQPSTSDGSLLLGNLTASTTSPPSFLTLNNFTLVNPPYANKLVTVTFTTENLVDSVFYLVDKGTVDIVSTPSTILWSECVVTNTSINAISKYTISFKTINRLITTSFIVIDLPSSMSIYNGTSCSLIGYASVCQVNSAFKLTVDINTIINGGTNLSIVINAVTNPPTTTPTASINITTYYEDAISVVDRLISGLTVTATSVPFRSVTLTPGSTIVGKIGNYTLNIQIANALPALSVLLIRIPSTTYATTTVTLLSFSIGSSVVSTCTLTNLSPLVLQLDPICFGSSTPALTTLKIVLGNITNPFSTKPSDSWQVETQYNSLQMEYLLSGIIATMDTPTSISFFKITPTSQTVNAQTSYLFQLTFQYGHYSGDRVILDLPSDILLGNGFQCVATTANVNIACNQTSTTQWEVIFTSTTGSVMSALSFTISKIINNWYSSTRTISVKTTTNNSIYYYVETGQNTVNFIPSTLSAAALSNEQIILLSQSNISLTITSPFTIPHSGDLSKMILLVTIPTDLVPVVGTCSPSYVSATCVVNGQVLNITGISDFATGLTIVFKAATNYFTTTSPFTSQLLYGSDLVASDTTMKLASYCTVPCKQCTSNKMQCLSCLPSPYTTNNTYLSSNNTCVVNCPTTYYASGGQCLACNSSVCLGCSNTANNCTSCQPNMYLYINTCLAVCPDTYYAANGSCNQCVSPCKNCTSQTVCLSCITNYFFDIDSKCVLTCSNVSYIGLNGRCQLCTSNCKTCSINLSNCTSCLPQYLLSNNTCRTGCPTSYYNNANTTCQPCISPCATCKSDIVCETCKPNYYLYNQTTCTLSCPDGTLAVVNSCQDCDPSCAKCSGVLSNCTSCATGYYFYLNECVLNCPPPTNPYNKICTLCIEPCATCTSIPDQCQSCLGSLLLLNNSCVTSCPINGYYQSDSSCLPCTNNCLSCQSLAACSLCENNYYILSGSCVQQCPQSSPIIQNRQCTSCAPECATCFGKATNCTKCTVFYFKYEYTCVKECPLTYYSNVVTYQCEDGLSSKIVFFPVLITSIIVIVLVLFSKCFARETSFITAVTALLSPLELVIWIYVLALLFAPLKQPDITYAIPISLIIVAIFSFFVLALIFFVINNRRMADDDYAVQWATNNTNYTVSVFIKFLSLLIGCRFFRIIYSRMFGSIHLGVAYKNRSNVFTPATIFTVCFFLFCQIPIIAGCWALVYNKTLKDQTFYSAIEALVVSVFGILFSLLDIYKSQDFFDETQFYKQKKYVEKIKDLSSMNKLQEGFEISNQAGSVDGQRFIGTSGGKFLYTKQKPQDLKDDDLYFGEEKSEVTDVVQKYKKINKKINIFGPIMEEDAQYYESQKYGINQTNTQNQIEQMNKKQKTIQSDEEEQTSDKLRRKQQIGPEDGFDDTRSMVNERDVKKKWNNIIDKRKQISDKIFNRHPPNLAQIDEPLIEDEDGHQESTAQIIRQLDYGENVINEQLGTDSQINSKKKKKRRKLRNREGNKELQQIYLQRLTDKKKSTKDMFSSDKSFKYDF